MQRLLPFIHRMSRLPEAPDDGQLLSAFVERRDESAFALMVQRHGPLVYGVCRRWLRESADVEDAFQATFLVLVRRAGTIARPQQLGNWLYGVALRTARKQGFRNLRIRRREEQRGNLASLSVHHRESNLDLGMVLDEELRRLPQKYRLPILLCHAQGLSRREASEIIGCPEGTLSARLARAAQLLRRRLTSRGFAPAVGLTCLAPAAPAVPAELVRSTVQAAVPYLLQPVLASARAVTLAEGVLHMLYAKRVSMLLASVFVVTALGAGTGLFFRQTAGGTVVAQQRAQDKQAPPVPSLIVKVKTEIGRAHV